MEERTNVKYVHRRLQIGGNCFTSC